MQKLLLLHGAIGSKKQLENLALHLKDTFEIHMMNFNGHGGEAFGNSFSIAQFADDVLDYIQKNHIDKINIFGYSMGGYVAVYLAKTHPEKIGKIFTLGTKFHWTPETAQREIKMLNPEKIAEKIPAFANELAVRHHPNDWKTVLHQTAGMMVAMGHHNPLTTADLSEIKIPVSVNVGENDLMVSIDETETVYKELPNAAFYVLPETPHPIEKVNLQKLTLAVTDFMMQ